MVTNFSGSVQKQTFMGSDGSIERYDDAYQVDEETYELAVGIENYILEQQMNIKHSFLKIGAALIKFEEQELFKARGVPSFRAYLSSDMFEFSYEHATRLMRIVKELVPILGEEGLPSLSKLKEILPMLGEGWSEDEIRYAVSEIENLNTRDAKARIREIRGIKDNPTLPFFKAVVKEEGDFNVVAVERIGGDDGDYYNAGTLYIKKKDWSRWADNFGEGFVEYVT